MSSVSRRHVLTSISVLALGGCLGLSNSEENDSEKDDQGDESDGRNDREVDRHQPESITVRELDGSESFPELTDRDRAESPWVRDDGESIWVFLNIDHNKACGPKSWDWQVKNGTLDLSFRFDGGECLMEVISTTYRFRIDDPEQRIQDVNIEY